MEEMLSQLKEFSITSEEAVLGVEDVSVDKGKEGVHFGLLGKLLMSKIIRFDVFKEMFQNLWRIRGGLEIRRLGSDLFLFNFNSEANRQRVRVNEPWHFDRALLLLKDLDPNDSPEECEFFYTHLWIQIHSLSISTITSSIGKIIGRQVGRVVDVV